MRSSTCSSRSRSTRRSTSRSRAESAAPLAEALEALPPIPDGCQWAHFVRNHDELTLDKLSDAEREEVFAAFGPEPEQQMYGRGLRRRLPSMLGGDQERMRMVYSLMFSLPGTPVLFYGEEIGMAENPAIEGRYAVRAPMQWSSEPHGGFTEADAAPVRPPVPDGPFGFPRVNVAAQRRDPGVAAQLDGAAHPAAAGVPGAGLGHVVAPAAGRRGGVRAARRTGAIRRSSPCTTSRGGTRAPCSRVGEARAR